MPPRAALIAIAATYASDMPCCYYAPEQAGAAAAIGAIFTRVYFATPFAGCRYHTLSYDTDYYRH